MSRKAIAAALFLLMSGLLALPSHAQELAVADDDSSVSSRDTLSTTGNLSTGSLEQSLLAGLSILSVRSAPETPASAFEPPGQPAGRPPEPPGQGNPPDPPGKPDGRPPAPPA